MQMKELDVGFNPLRAQKNLNVLDQVRKKMEA